MLFQFIFSVAPPPSKSAVRGRPQTSITNGSSGPISNGFSSDIFGSSPFFSANTNVNGKTSTGASEDPFGMGEFSTTGANDSSQHDIESAIGFLDKRLLEMKVCYN